MIPMTVAEIAAVIGADTRHGIIGDSVVSSVEFDTRRISPGAMFVALRGERVDGHAFVSDAAEAGAVAVLGSADIDSVNADLPMLRMRDDAAVLAGLAALAEHAVGVLVRDDGLQVIGVTGSAGKTSTKDLIAAVLRGEGATVAPPESFNNELGHPYTALRADAATRFLVLELSARGAGHIASLARVGPPRVGVVLNVGSAHLGEFGSVDAIATAKAELVQALPAASDGGVAVLNADDPRVAAMAGLTAADVVTFSANGNPAATVLADEVRTDAAGRASFQLRTPEGNAPVSLRLVGAHQVGNALAAAAVGRAVGMPVERVAEALSAATPASKWRMEATALAGGITVLNDAYNANPDSMRAALQTLASLGRAPAGRPRRTWAVLGEMAELGPGAVAAHDEIGRLVVRLGIDRLIVVHEGPAGSGPGSGSGKSPTRALHLGAHLEGSWGGESELVDSVAAAVGILAEELAEGDVVLIKASRSVGLERVAAGVLAALPGPESTDPPGPSAQPGISASAPAEGAPGAAG